MDIDRLHQVVEGKLIGRRQGHTFLSITYLATAVSFQEPVIYCALHVLSDIERTKETICEVFSDYGLPKVKWIGRTNFECYNSKVFFVLINTHYSLNGLFKAVPSEAPLILLFEDYQGYDLFAKQDDKEKVVWLRDGQGMRKIPN